MIHYKTQDEIEIMRDGGKRLKKIVVELKTKIRAGKTTLAIDEEATRLIKKYGGEPSFTKVKGYFWSTCLPINEQIVHTPPSSRILKEGDVLTLDIGFFFQGYHTDYADTWIIGDKSEKRVVDFLNTGKLTLRKAIEVAKVGNYIGDISEVIETEITRSGYFVIKQLTGHGIGKKLHEEPQVFGFLHTDKKETVKIKPGLTIAIEVIYSMGTDKFRREKNNSWSIITADGSLSACFEHSIAIQEKKTLILT